MIASTIVLLIFFTTPPMKASVVLVSQSLVWGQASTDVVARACENNGLPTKNPKCFLENVIASESWPKGRNGLSGSMRIFF